jgi:hypothetical protein
MEAVPALWSALEWNHRGRAMFEATGMVLALRKYRQEHGRLPDRLEDLAGGYVKKLPRDPYGPGTLVYRRVGDDFILYSRRVCFRFENTPFFSAGFFHGERSL